MDKVRRILGLGAPKTGNKLVISVEKLERRVALLENGRLEEYNVERNTSRNIVGSVYKGKVKNIEMGLKAMFVDKPISMRSEEHTSELQSRSDLVCRLLLEKKKEKTRYKH